jgi:DNA-binding SARP family transcriptional activator
VTVRVRLLGGFDVTVDGDPVAPDAWSRRQAAALVKLLALTESRRLHREQVMEALWPGLPLESATPRFHKAAHFARKALSGDGDAVQVRGEFVTLLPGSVVRIDVHEFLRAGRRALDDGSPDALEAALKLARGELLPEDRYETWTQPTRDAVGVLRADLLRAAGRWEELLALDPADEPAHLALARGHAARGDTRAALRQLERLEQALRRELGTTPSAEAEAFRRKLAAAPQHTPKPARRLFGRRHVADEIRSRLDEAAAGGGGVLALVGPAGVGKTSLLDLAQSEARRAGFRIARGSASAMEGPWPYAPVLEAFGRLCRSHPGLLDTLNEGYRTEIERAVSGRAMQWSGESDHQRLFVAAAELVRLAAGDRGLLLVVDDAQDADEASLRLLHYLGRVATSEPVLIALAHRPAADPATRGMLDSIVARTGRRIEVNPLGDDTLRRLLQAEQPGLTPDAAEQILKVSSGIPFTALELAHHQLEAGTATLIPSLPEDVLHTFRRMALLGTTFSTDELLALADVDEDKAYLHLHEASNALLVEPDEPTGHRFRHQLLRDALIEQLPRSLQLAERRLVAERLAVMGAPASRVAHQFITAGLPSRAVPFVLSAVETAGALGAHRDALSLIDEVRDHADGDPLTQLLARRGDLLMAVGDPRAVTAYTDALPFTTGTQRRLVRARLARAATAAGDTDTARAALAGLEPEGDAADGPILVARAELTYFAGDIDKAWAIAGQARDMLTIADETWQLADLVGCRA